LVYAGAAIAAGAVVVSSAWDEPDIGQVLVAARQLFGLWALGLLLASMLLGPLTSVFPWLPLRPTLMYGRRAIGVSALMFALLHVTAYGWSVFRRNWHEFYTPGVLWVVGLSLGLLALIDLVVLGVTSRDASVKSMGGRRWKRLHRSVYLVLPVILLHSVFVGADFGVNRGPDVRGEADAGALVGFLCLSAAWAALALLRRRGVSWTRTFEKRKDNDGASVA
jgi:sulfoxide reductase heme-binding subunit YedZ